MGRIGVVVADAQRLFVESMSRALQEHPDLNVSQGRSTTGREAVKEVTRFKPDVALLDFWITGLRGPAATRAILKVLPAVKVFFLSEFFIGPGQIKEAHAAGAIGFLRKDLALETVVAAVRDANRCSPGDIDGLLPAQEAWPTVPGSGPDRPTEAQRPHPGLAGDDRSEDRSRRLTTLTNREIEVLQLLRQGLATKQLARELSITVGTLKNHIHNIIVKTGASTQLEAVNIAEEGGYISDT